MTIRKRLARSNIAMLVIPIFAAALLLLLGLGAALLLLRGNLMTLHDAVEQIEAVLHGFKLTLSVFAAVAVLLMLAAVAETTVLTMGPLAADTAATVLPRTARKCR